MSGTEYRNPTPTVDAIIEVPGDRVVLIRRSNPPLGWAFPGGFVDEGERVEDAAIREALEETCLDVELVCLLGVYSDPSRDPRMHTMSCVYVARSEGTPTAADDAAHVEAVPVDRLLDREFAFDHAEIARDYLNYRANGTVPPPRPVSGDA